MSLNPFLFDKLPYDPDRDFEPITGLFFVTELLAASVGLPANTVPALKEFVAQKPDSLNWGTLGSGSYPELFLKWINNQWNAKIVAVPYTGGGPIAQAMAGDQIQLGSMGIGNFLGVLQTNKVKPLAVSSVRRSPLMLQVPTFAEAGIGGYPGRAWWGLAAPAGTPLPVVERISREFEKLFKEEKFIALLDANAVVGFAGSPEEFKAFLRKDRVDAEALIKIANQPRTEYKQP
jgi:tripartite-type tricarboxylate transporter receptor subunit TctC